MPDIKRLTIKSIINDHVDGYHAHVDVPDCPVCVWVWQHPEAFVPDQPLQHAPAPIADTQSEA